MTNYKTTLRKTNNTKRVQLTDFEPTITDQDAGSELTMKSIVAKLDKGIIPVMKEGIYLMTPTTAVNYQDVHQLKKDSFDFYNRLPSNIKKAMGNDYTNLEEFMHDPKNTELLLQEGLIVKREESTNLVTKFDKTLEMVQKLTDLHNPTDPIKKDS